MNRRHRHLVAMAAAIAVTSFGSAFAQSQPEAGPTLEVHVRTWKQDGTPMGRSDGGSMFVPGRLLTWFVMAGIPYTGELTVCGNGVGDSGTLADKLTRAAYVWEIRMRPVKYENGTATFDLEWARYQPDVPGRPAVESKTTMTLREGDSRPIDFLRSAPGSRTCPNAAVIVEIGSGYKEPPAAVASILQYDLWLKHEHADGRVTTRRFSAMAPPGADVAFAFAPLRFAIPGAADGAASDLLTTVQGTIKGRLLPNQRIAVTVDTSRRDGFDAQGRGGGGWIGNQGRKALDLAADEAVEIELPAPGGFSSRLIGTGGAATAVPRPQAITVQNGRITVDNTLFFQGQRTSVVLQVHFIER